MLTNFDRDDTIEPAGSSVCSQLCLPDGTGSTNIAIEESPSVVRTPSELFSIFNRDTYTYVREAMALSSGWHFVFDRPEVWVGNRA